MKLGILGGTFNPIHFGHLKLAQESMTKLNLDEVIFVPTYTSPFEPNEESITAQHRFNMLKLALAPYDKFEISTFEIDKKGISYTIDTLKYFKSKLNDNEQLYFIAGSDVLTDLNKWKNVDEIFALCTFVVAKRPGFHVSNDVSHIKFINIEARNISSSKIRDMLKKREDIEGLVPDRVLEYIRDNGLYK
jgi:nicotinate-nucleotide adenylyltransferase